MGLSRFSIEFEDKAPELEIHLRIFLSTVGSHLSVKELTQPGENFKEYELWNNPSRRTDVFIRDNEIEIEVMLAQPLDIADMLIKFFEARGGCRKVYD